RVVAPEAGGSSPLTHPMTKMRSHDKNVTPFLLANFILRARKSRGVKQVYVYKIDDSLSL
ncbi:MAG: hypothetical protein JXC33_03465, partial [Deltaproteobacteria bacterium]|nr:hypothetical protein [Deltaproteobacteria bacterium]